MFLRAGFDEVFDDSLCGKEHYSEAVRHSHLLDKLVHISLRPCQWHSAVTLPESHIAYFSVRIGLYLLQSVQFRLADRVEIILISRGSSDYKIVSEGSIDSHLNHHLILCEHPVLAWQLVILL